MDKFGTIDGNGPTTFFLAKLKGNNATPSTDDVLCATQSDGSLRAIIRQGQDVPLGFPAITSVKTIGTLVGLKGTLAEGRWNQGVGPFAAVFSARLSFLANRPEGIYLAFDSATDFSLVWNLVSVGDTLPAPLNGAKIKSLGPTGCGDFVVVVLATLVRAAGFIDATNDVAVIRVDGDDPTEIFAIKGGIPPDGNGSGLNDAFKTFGAPLMGKDEVVAFTATLARSTGAAATGIWQGQDAASLRLIARGADPAPAGGRFATFTSLVLPDGQDRGVIFTGTLAVSTAEGVTTANKTGLWAVNSHGVLIGLLRTGDKIAGVAGQTRTIKSFRALEPAPGSIGAANGYDNAGHVAALVTFTDGKIALVEFTIP